MVEWLVERNTGIRFAMLKKLEGNQVCKSENVILSRLNQRVSQLAFSQVIARPNAYDTRER